MREEKSSLWEKKFSASHYIFTKNYSGTWWGAEQCVVIDAMREVLDKLLQDGNILQADFDLGLTCLIHSIAEISTNAKSGHYTQYKEAKNQAGVAAIAKCRNATLWRPFRTVLNALLSWQTKQKTDLKHEIFSLDYRECLQKIENSVVYADPLHAAVEYSRSYHAIETLVCYDYPELKRAKGLVVKGRYRSDLHRSPFCNKAQIEGAFFDLFDGVKKSKSDLLLSYSKTVMIDLDKVVALANSSLGEKYEVSVDKIDYSRPLTGGRGLKKEDLDWLIIAKKL